MLIDTVRRADGAKKKRVRVGRGTASGHGKTSRRGHKGQKARSGGRVPLGFEGGQMPLQRRLPKSGFNSTKALTRDEIRLAELAKVDGDEVSPETLRKAGLVSANIKDIKIILQGEVKKAYKVSGVRVTKGAKAAIEKAGGKVEE